MIFAGDNNYLCFSDFINKAMLVIDAARPVALQIGFERFGFADAVKRIFSGF